MARELNDADQKRVRQTLYQIAQHAGAVVTLPTRKGQRRFMVCGSIDESGRPHMDHRHVTWTLAPMDDWPESGRRILLGELVTEGLVGRYDGAKRALETLLDRVAMSAKAAPGCYDVAAVGVGAEEPF